MHPEDMKSRAAGILCVAGGATLTWLAWHWKLNGDQSSLKAAFIGPTLLVLGIGMLVHGRGIPTAGATRLTRAYGLAGGVAGIVNLHAMGYFSHPSKSPALGAIRAALPVAMLGVWLLPSRVFGAAIEKPRESTTDKSQALTGVPIDPK